MYTVGKVVVFSLLQFLTKNMALLVQKFCEGFFVRIRFRLSPPIQLGWFYPNMIRANPKAFNIHFLQYYIFDDISVIDI